jgi:hypothetical protein
VHAANEEDAMRRQIVFAVLPALLVTCCLVPRPLAAAIGSDQAAALITFPYVTIDSSRGLDTAVRLSNADRTAPVDVRCFLEDLSPRCVLNPAQTCINTGQCPAGDLCDEPPAEQLTQFAFRLTAGQPITWRLSAGLAALPLPANTGAIPAAPEDPFIGALRCVALEAGGTPSERNVLQGEAIHERSDAALGLLDAATYNGLGLLARPAAMIADDGKLTLGGAAGGYEGCPGVLRLNHFFDFAFDPVSNSNQLFTTLALLPCSAELWHGTPFEPTATVVQYIIFNEFEQRFSTSSIVRGQSTTRLSAIDTTVAERSVFSAGVAGTLAGHTQIEAFGVGIMAVAVEAHQSIADPNRVTTAAFNVHSEGERSASDALVTAFKCPAAPQPGCRSARASRLRLDQRPSAEIGRVKWEWRSGQATDASEFGDPVHTTQYGLCMYAGTSAAEVASFSIPAGSRWTASRRGFTYADPSRAADGVAKIALQGSRSDHARAVLNARGGNVPPLGLTGALATPVVVQLVNNETTICLESVFDGAAVLKNEPGKFEGRARTSP